MLEKINNRELAFALEMLYYSEAIDFVFENNDLQNMANEATIRNQTDIVNSK